MDWKEFEERAIEEIKEKYVNRVGLTESQAEEMIRLGSVLPGSWWPGEMEGAVNSVSDEMVEGPGNTSVTEKFRDGLDNETADWIAEKHVKFVCSFSNDVDESRLPESVSSEDLTWD